MEKWRTEFAGIVVFSRLSRIRCRNVYTCRLRKQTVPNIAFDYRLPETLAGMTFDEITNVSIRHWD